MGSSALAPRSRSAESVRGAMMVQFDQKHSTSVPTGVATGSVCSHRPRSFASVVLIAICAVAVQDPVFGSYHFMQIEQVIGGVDGNTSAQAIQLRMRVNAQSFLNKAVLYAVDAVGENPVLLIDFTTDVSSAAAGDRVLAVTEDFLLYTQPAAEADFVLAAPIPSSYRAAGSLIFENNEGTLLVWRLSWGGGGYTGDTTGALTNDDDREFGPPFSGALPSEDLRALLFQGDSSAKSASNNADYALTADAAVFTNNAGQTFTVTALDCPNDPDNDIDHDGVCGDVDNCPDVANADQNDADRDGLGTACDSCPEDGGKSDPGACGCGVPDVDTDEDGVADCVDNCPEVANADQSDRDADGAGDACDGCPDDPELIVAAFCPITIEPNPDGGSDSSGGGADGGAVGGGSDNGGDGLTPVASPRACGAGIIGLLALVAIGLLPVRRSRCL